MAETEFVRSIEIGAGQAKAIPEIVGEWWKVVSKESASAATPGKLYAIGNYLVGLVKNSLGDGKSDGRVTATFDSQAIQIEVEALSGSEREINLNVGGSYGMKEAIEYADDFMVELDGKRWEKAKVKELLEEAGESEVRVGSKVTFFKYIVVPVEEEDEEGNSFGGSRW